MWVEEEDITAMVVWTHHKNTEFCASICMPRWAARIFLAVVDARPERLQAITEADCYAEGIAEWTSAGQTFSPRIRFQEFWESIHGKGAWAKNPWVWRYRFKLIENQENR